jgi:IS30 family transposase
MGVKRSTAAMWVVDAGGMTAANHGASGARLSLADRDEIAVLHAQGIGVRQIARALGRAPSTISRELRAASWRVDSRLPSRDCAAAGLAACSSPEARETRSERPAS